MAADGRRVLAIGLDAASLPFVEQLVDEGGMANLARLRAASARWDIDGGIACARNLQWNQFAFGHPLETDRGDLFRFDPETYRCSMPDAAPELVDGTRQFWDREDLRTIVFDIPETALVPTYAAVAGWGGHAPRGPRASYPPGLVTELDRAVGIHRGLGNDYDSVWHDARASAALADALVDGAARRGRALVHLLGRFPDWDLTIAVMSELHSAGHYWIHGGDPTAALHATPTATTAREQLHRVYEAVDAAVGEMVAAAPEDTTVVLFSHDDMIAGHADCPSLVLLPELLQRLHDGVGLLRRTDAEAWHRDGHPPITPATELVWRDHVDGQLLDPPARGWRQRSIAYRRAKRARPVRAALERRRGRPIGPQGNVIPAEVPAPATGAAPAAVDSNDVLFTAHYQPHWSRMRAFALPGFTGGGVRINLVGRERDGIVPLEAYEAECRRIEAEVRACRNPRTGRPVVQDVLRPRAADPLAPDGDTVDLAFVWAPELVDAFEHPVHGLIGPVPAHRPGVHGRRGFLSVLRQGEPSGDRGTRPAWDIPATLLALAGATPGPGVVGEPVLPASEASVS